MHSKSRTKGAARGQPVKPVIAIPSEPVRKAGARVLEFKSSQEAADYFGVGKSRIWHCINSNPKHHPASGYYFDYLEKDD